MTDDEISPQESTGVSTNRLTFIASGASIGAAMLSGCIRPMLGGSSMPTTGTNSTNATNSTNSTSGMPTGVNPNKYATYFDNRVNIVKEGADNTGKEPIDDVLEHVFDNDTLVYFPLGRYKFNTNHQHVGLRNLGIVGSIAILTHGTVEAIRGFNVHEGEYHRPAQHFKIGIPENPHRGKFLFGGFTVDWRGKNQGMQILNHHFVRGISVPSPLSSNPRLNLDINNNWKKVVTSKVHSWNLVPSTYDRARWFISCYYWTCMD